MRIPLAALNVKTFPADQTWGLLLARDYPGVEQTAVVRSDDWRHGTANRVRGFGFYNLYRNAEDYLQMRFPDGAKPVRVQIAYVPAGPRAEAEAPSAYFSGYHRLDTQGQTRSEESLSVYNPIRNEIFVRTRLGSVRRGMEAQRLVVSVRRKGEREPRVTHVVTNRVEACIGLRMNNGPHVKPFGMVVEWIAPGDGTADVDYRMANICKPLPEPGEGASARERAHYRASIDGGQAMLVQVPAGGGEPIVRLERR
ncbi:MAG: hypothetical protein GX615_05660, partial [Lentisphaerae bacterium]|nr:hypothetical protein [Lentisphaerota bacterium]